MHVCSYDEKDHREAVLRLLANCRAAGFTNREITSSRLQMLISTRLSQPHDNTWLWKNDAGQLQAAVFMLQRGFGRPLEMTYLVSPDSASSLEAEVFEWGLQRRVALEREQGTAIGCIVLLSEHRQTTMALLEQMGFSRLEDHAPCMARSLNEQLPEPTTLPGYGVRALTDNEIERYCGLYNAVMLPITIEQRKNLMSSTGYMPELNLVVQADDATLVAFCECSLDKWQGQNEGWLEHVGVHPAYQRRSLGRLVVATALQTLKAAGLEHALLMTASTNNPALNLYSALGFQTIERNLIFARQADV